MSTRRFELPEAVRLRAESLGEEGLAWLASLGATVEHLETAWSISVGKVLSGGSESLAAEARQADGTLAILKVGLPGSANLAKEAQVYELAAGRGYAELIAHEPASNALLLERLGAPLASTGATTDEQIRHICATLHEAWIPLAGSHGLMTGAEKSRWLVDFIVEAWDALDQPCDRRTVDRALTFAQAREDAFSADSAVLVHGDAHALNTLAVLGPDGAASGRYKFVDPDGLYAERACDLACPMRDWNEELLAGDTVALARRRCELLARLCSVDPEAIWQWGFVERVSTGLTLLQIGMQEEGVAYLAAADRLRGA